MEFALLAQVILNIINSRLNENAYQFAKTIRLDPTKIIKEDMKYDM